MLSGKGHGLWWVGKVARVERVGQGTRFMGWLIEVRVRLPLSVVLRSKLAFAALYRQDETRRELT